MDLDVRTGGDVGDASPVIVEHRGESIHLVGGHRAAGHLDALHIARVIELVVQAVGEPDRAELAFLNLPATVGFDATRVKFPRLVELLLGRSHRRLAPSGA